ncbi:TIGR04282 family arsenosugar biosynthesis glycosyltransferase [Oceanibium sediminis]|uniref:TIGR04282 family arsenosugar biosynthesis glycosyltransferase n=1 Tax=Oceanibium sediminis TaxID=2026339 RepID=UPI0018E4FBE4
MLKEPRPGRVKTRLGRDIGMVPAAWWFRHQSTALIRRLAPDRRWRTWLAVSPDAEGLQSRVWPAGPARLAQGGGDLGQRMARQFRALPPGPALIIGADIPDITPARIADAFRALGAAQAVIGPAPDGGYWCIGLKHPRAAPATLLRGVRWSTAHARADTEASLAGLRIAHTATLRDVDTSADLR